MKHLPNTLTVLRIVVTPVVLAGVVRGGVWGYGVAWAVFVAAAISDWYDGHLARRHGSHSRLGQFLDPLADKILVLGTFAALAWRRPDLAPWWAVALIALRDVGVTLLRSVVEARGRSLRTLPMAKTKTALQLTFLISVLLFLAVEAAGGTVGGWATALLTSPIPLLLLVALVVVTVGTGLLYVVRPQYTR